MKIIIINSEKIYIIFIKRKKNLQKIHTTYAEH
jgi:hypothetical protein